MEFQPNEARAVLARTPATLTALLSGLPTAWVLNNEGGESFSPFEVLGHLIDAEQSNWLPRAAMIRDGATNTPFPPFDRFASREHNTGRPLSELLEEFATLRHNNLQVLQSWAFTPQDLQQTGLHPQFGTVTLRQLLATWVAHDLGHIAQVVRVMAKQYRQEVGPWAAFLPILSDREPV